MQKSFLIVLIIAVLGAVALSQFAPTLPAYIAFVAGVIITTLVFKFAPETSST